MSVKQPPIFLSPCPLMIAFLNYVFNFDAIIDLGSGTFQVGTLRRVGSGNPIEAILNSQSKRFSPTVVAFDGEQFHVGEYGEAYAKKNPGPVFRHFTTDPIGNLSKFANDPDAPELEEVLGYQSILLVTALMNHIVTNMIARNDTQIDITLIHPPSLSLSKLSAFKQAIEQLPNTTLFMTVPTPAAVVITHLASRMKDFDQDKKGQQFIIVDIGATSTDLSVVHAEFKNESSDVEVSVMYTDQYQKGGEDINNCLILKYVDPKLEYDKNNFKLKKRIYDGVEKAKIALSANQLTRIVVDSAFSNGDDFVTELTRDELDVCVAELFNEQTLESFQNVAFHIDPDFGEDTFYLFYGGSSRIIKLQNFFEDFFGSPILRTVNLDEGAIYGGGLVAARHIVGFKVANRFNALDKTRPYLWFQAEDKENNQRLNKLNPQIKFGMVTAFPRYSEETFTIGNGSFNVNHINESYYYETDESGKRDKKSSQLYNTDSVEYSKIISNPDPFTALKFVTYVDDETQNETYFEFICNLTIAKFDHKTILKKYEPKKKDQSGMSGIKIQKMPEIRKDTKAYSDSVEQFHKLLMDHLRDQTVRDKYDLRLFLNFTSDSTSMPNMTQATMKLIDKDALAKGVKQQKIEGFIEEFQFEPQCEFKHNLRFMVDEFIFREAFNVVWDSNDIQMKRKEYETNFNMIDTILINADEFLAQYPASNETEGNFLIYADEADFLRVAIDDAKVFMKYSYLLPHCPCVECLEERIHDLNSVVGRVLSLQANISKHVEQAQCRPKLATKYAKSVQEMEDAIASVDEFEISERGEKYKITMNQSCQFIKDSWIDVLDDKEEKKDDDKDKDKDKEKDEAWKAREALKKQVVAKMKSLSKDQREQEYFKMLFENYGKANNISESDYKGLEEFFTKGMMKKLKKGNNDCGFLNGSHHGMIKKRDNFTNSKDGKRKDFIEFKEKYESEFSMRPETECEKIKNKTKDLDKEVEELTRKVKDLKTEMDRARLINVVKVLYESAQDYKRLMSAYKDMQVALKDNNYQQLTKLIVKEIKIDTTDNDVQRVFSSGQLKAKFEKISVDNIDRVLDEIKDSLKGDEEEGGDDDYGSDKDEL